MDEPAVCFCEDVDGPQKKQDVCCAERGVAQALDAHRIVGRKYEGGLAAITELLDASTTEVQARLAEAAARYAVITALTDRLQATGNAPAWLSRLDTLP